MLKRWGKWLVNGYGVMLALYLLLRAGRGERSQYVELLNHVMPGLALPVLPLFLWALIHGERARAALLLPGMIALLAQYDSRHPAGIARGKEKRPAVTAVSVLTFNLQGQRIRTVRLLQLIRELKPDVLCFQELTEPVAAALTEALHAQYPHEQVMTQGITIHGAGIYSRFPLVDCEALAGDHGHLRAIVVVDEGQAFALYNVHPPPPGGLRNRRGFQPSLRRGEVDAILTRAVREILPVVLVGDFNLTDRTADYRQLTAHYTDAFFAAGRGPRATFPDLGGIVRPLGGSWFGGLRLDYVFHSPQIQAVSVRVIADAAGSDHRPVFALLAL